MKAAITTSSFGKYDPAPLDRLIDAGVQYVLNPHGRKVTEEEIIELAQGVDGIIAGTEPLNSRVLNHLPGLKAVSRCGVGMENVDMKAAENLGIKVFNTPDGPTLAVAEVTVALILGLLRKITWMSRQMKDGIWQKQMGSLLSCKKIGIIGFGRIGRKVAELLHPFGVELVYCDLEPKSCSIRCSRKKFEEILGWADIISLHLSPSVNCKPVIGEKELSEMKKGSWLVNISRGGVVDEEALYHCLEKGHIAGAALDVFDQEPYCGPLRHLPNVILTPHIGSYAKEARIEMEMQAVENLLRGLRIKRSKGLEERQD